MAGRFDGRRALVTGGGSGLGLAIAKKLAADGAHVVVAGRRIGLLAEAVAAVRAAGGHADAVSLDVAEPISVSAAFAGMKELHTSIPIKRLTARRPMNGLPRSPNILMIDSHKVTFSSRTTSGSIIESS